MGNSANFQKSTLKALFSRYSLDPTPPKLGGRNAHEVMLQLA